MDYETKTKLDLILDWADDTVWFDASIFIGIKYHYEEYNEFTHEQKEEINIVYSKWKIEIWNTKLLKKKYI